MKDALQLLKRLFFKYQNIIPNAHQGSTLSIISVYAPTNVSEIEQKLEFYDQLQEITTNVSKKNLLFICGDINARVGRTSNKENEWHGILGNYGMGKENENGSFLLEFCSRNNLRVCNTFFKHNLGTWKHLAKIK